MRKLSPKLEKWLEAYYSLVQKMVEEGFKQTPTNAREGLADLTKAWVKRKRTVTWVQDDLVEGDEFDVPVRIYHPRPEEPLPVFIYFHGGGHMGGSITVYDPICRRMAKETGHIVISVDYRLAPECPYPAGITDGVTVARNIWRPLRNRGVNFIRKLSIGGDSAGGAICATVANLSQFDGDFAIRSQVMIYPSLDYTLEQESIKLNGQGYLLHREKIEWYFDNYFQAGEDRKAASPLHMDFTQAMPEALVITAEFCPLRDEGLAYLQKLKRVGVRAEHLHFENMIHAFVNLEDLVEEECSALYRKVNAFLNR